MLFSLKSTARSLICLRVNIMWNRLTEFLGPFPGDYYSMVKWGLRICTVNIYLR